MENVLEMLMVVCFGISWPLNIRKLIKSKTAKGTRACLKKGGDSAKATK